MKHTISREQIRAKLNSGEPITLVEALPPQYFNKHHLPNAINIPHDQVADLAADLLPDQALADIEHAIRFRAMGLLVLGPGPTGHDHRPGDGRGSVLFAGHGQG